MKKHFLIILFLFFYFAVTAYKLIVYPTPFYDWDEAIYAQVGREMVEKKSLIPLWQGQYWLDKPPLTPLVYGIVETLIPLPPEFSTRLFTLILSIIILILTYIFYFRIIKNKTVALISMIVTSFTPIFLQRTQVLNVDVFLFLGWIGYLVFYPNFWFSFLFLAIGVLSKSLLGFYPAIGFFCLLTFQLASKKINLKEYKKQVTTIGIQIGILALWYLVMIAAFKTPFVQAQFLEAHLKRVTASIESHFGRRTFYLDLLFQQLGIFAYLSIAGFIFIVRDFFRKKDWQKIILSLFFVPWFLFLNLTKTKITWYLYPVIAQFAFLGAYVLLYLRKYLLITTLATIAVIVVIFNQAFRQNKFFTTFYSSYDQYYQLAIYAKKNCREIELLVDPDTRQTYDTLNRMGLTISTTKWWGNHPSIVYYSGKKVNFIYFVNDFQKLINSSAIKKECFILNEEEEKYLTQKLKLLKKFKELNLFVK